MKTYALPGLAPDAAPLLIGEFHYGARDRGGARGLRGGDTQADRAEMATTFLETIAGHPGIVGAHWFELYDQPLTGRVKDGENYHVGFLDVTDTPYEAITTAVRDGLILLNTKRYGAMPIQAGAEASSP
jgi:agarase